ncbi:EF-hand domain-containing protein [Roseovarius dicentrarchi]|uniref:EF-hand domain-containing protein n=1 Tax=Roseovarius dicentrarchi TaxID=2250573 RepID=UPI0013966D5D|nr:EF-hand domain-containing protein [Roseovarius dicentrarchi]
MTYSKIIPGTLVAVVALASGLTFANAQTAPNTAPMQMENTAQGAMATRADYRRGHGKRGGHGMMGQIMRQADANGDGAVTQDEIDTFRAGLVANADASGDGDISLDEFQTIYLELTRERMVDMFQKLDADGDGVVTQAEMDKRFGNIVERMDRNDDGKLSRDDKRGHGGKGHGGKGQGRDGERKGNRSD